MRLYTKLLQWAKAWWFLLIVLLLTITSYYVLSSLESHFLALTGIPIFDTQQDLTESQLFEQTNAYEGEARQLYYQIAIVDFVFPLLAAIFFSSLWAICLSHTQWRFAQTLLNRGFPLLPLIATLVDYLENLFFLGMLHSSDDLQAFMRSATVSATRLKFFGLNLIALISIFLLGLVVANWIYRFLQREQQ